MSTGSINHVTEVIKLMTQILYLLPSFCSSPSMWFLRINGTGGIEITIRFLCRRHYIEHTVYIGLQFLVGICLKHVARTFNSLIHIGIVERETHEFRHIILIAWVGGFYKIRIAPLTLTFAECQRYGNLSCGLDALSPKRVLVYLNRCEWHLGYRITTVVHLAFLCLHATGRGEKDNCC